MNGTDEEITASVISRSSDSLLTRDTGQTHRSQLAAHLILASTLLERIAFYSISANLVFTLGQNTQLKWSVSNSSMASFMFSGKYDTCDILLNRNNLFSCFLIDRCLMSAEKNRARSFLPMKILVVCS